MHSWLVEFLQKKLSSLTTYSSSSWRKTGCSSYKNKLRTFFLLQIITRIPSLLSIFGKGKYCEFPPSRTRR